MNAFPPISLSTLPQIVITQIKENGLSSSISYFWKNIRLYFNQAFNQYNYSLTLNTILHLPHNSLYTDEANELFQTLEMHGIIAEKNRRGVPCDVLNAALKEAALKCHFIFIERFLKSGAFITLENWFLLSNSHHAHILQWVSLFAIYQNYEKDLKKLAEIDSLMSDNDLIRKLIFHANKRQKNFPGEKVFWKKPFFDLLKPYIKNKHPIIQNKFLKKWILNSYTASEIYHLLAQNPFLAGVDILSEVSLKEGSKTDWIFQAAHELDSSLLLLMIRQGWLDDLSLQNLRRLWRLIQLMNLEEAACAVYESGYLVENKDAPKKKVISNKNNTEFSQMLRHACQAKWLKFLKLFFVVNERDPLTLLKIDHPPVFNLFINHLQIGQSHFESLIHWSLEKKDIEKIHLLFEHFSSWGISKELMDDLALWAIEEKHVELFRDLLKRGLRVNLRLDHYIYPLDYALVHHSKEILDELLKVEGIKGKLSLLQRAIWKGSLPSGIPLKDFHNDTNFAGQTPLHFALMLGRSSLVESLLDQGVDINAQDDQGNTPLHFCRLYHRDHEAQQILNKGADPYLPNKKGKIPLSYDCQYSDLFYYESFRKDLKKSLKPSNHKQLELFIMKMGFFQNFQMLKLLEKNYQTEVMISLELIRRKELAHYWGCMGKTNFKGVLEDLEAWTPEVGCQGLVKSMLAFFKQTVWQKALRKIQRGLYPKFLKGIESMVQMQSMQASEIFQRWQKEEPIILITGWMGHVTAFVLYKQFFAKVNRGENSHLFAIEVFQILHSHLVDTQRIQEIQNSKNQAFFLYGVDKVLQLQFLEGIELSEQKVGNCSMMSSKTAVLAMFYLLFRETPLKFPLKKAKYFYKQWNQAQLKAKYQSYLRESPRYDKDLIESIRSKAARKGIDLDH